jgi:hypothetical protein
MRLAAAVLAASLPVLGAALTLEEFRAAFNSLVAMPTPFSRSPPGAKM